MSIEYKKYDPEIKKFEVDDMAFEVTALEDHTKRKDAKNDVMRGMVDPNFWGKHNSRALLGAKNDLI